MKFVVAIDSFKSTMTSKTACETAASGIKTIFPDSKVVMVPAADGGEGTVRAFFAVLGGEIVKKAVTGPEFQPVEAEYVILPNGTAVVEMAAASGLPLVTVKNPEKTTTYGTGELIADAIRHGCKNIILGLGGSATNDGAVGALSALGVRFLKSDGNPIDPTGGGLAELVEIDASTINTTAKNCRFTIACDVENTLCGPEGASAVYGPQKGATPEMVRRLDGNLKKFADIIREKNEKDILTLKGGGAAGGFAAGFSAFFDAELKSGIKLLLETVHFDEIIKDADYIFTGEGRVDSQSAYGKVISGIGAYAQKAGVPVIAVAGNVSPDYEAVLRHGVTAVFSINHLAVPFETAKLTSQKDLQDTVANICRLIQAAKK
ncbi:MAG TPA: glycerate kinase [Oscillospiraceae bacterium]|nr:glycerate kinase [Oscillospiraceae bacterium]HPF55284.1 glycerate kinase [Clostridiales bacterium]HPK34688.1 glycerate kinase [Oscillospiraceae bacterium]HPR74548.1 glycerate kinase [Oscillospiraceae bacterium]